MELEEIRRRLFELAKEKEMMEESLQEAMVSAIQEIAKENPYGIKRMGGIKVMTIKSSHLIDKPWSMEFFDWEESANVILKYLKNTPAINWKKKLEELLESKGETAEIKRRGMIWPGYTGIVERTPVDKMFIRKIIEKI